MGLAAFTVRAWAPLALALAVLIYGIAGTPAPPGLRPQEMLIAACLLVAMGWRGPLCFISGLVAGKVPAVTPPMLSFAGPFLVAVALLGLARGLWNGASAVDLLRDLLPLGFLALPVLLAPLLGRLDRWHFDRLADAVALAGVLLVLRWLAGAGTALAAAGTAPLGEGSDYLLNSAFVPFAAVWFPLRALSLWRGGDGWPLPRLRAVAGLAGALLCLAALAVTVHRAALGLSLLALTAGLWRAALRHPVRSIGLGFIGLLLLVALGNPLAAVAGLAAEKTQAVGLNNRVGEAMAVLEQIAGDAPTLLTGDGWGALLVNPAVGGWRVSYTHSAASYFLLKVGVLGLAGMAAYAGVLAGAAWARRPLPMDLLLAVAPSILIGLFLHTSFKYLCFSILISLVVNHHRNALEKTIDSMHPPRL